MPYEQTCKKRKIRTNHQTLVKLLFTSNSVQPIIVEDCRQQKVASDFGFGLPIRNPII